MCDHAAPDNKAAEFRTLLDRVFAGDEEAAGVLLERYQPALRLTVRSLLNQELRSRYDSLDFVQDVWASFFAHPPELPLENPSSLVRFLKTLARNKVVEATRQCFRGEKRNVNREYSLDNPAIVAKNKLVAEQPPASAGLRGEEEWQQFLRTLAPAYQAVMILLRDGRDPAEIAVQLGVNERTVYRIINRCVRGQKP